MSVGKHLKETRSNCGKTQQQLSQELNICRESVSAYETERAKLPPDISKELVKKYDDPFFAMKLANEFTGTMGVVLDGMYVDTHRSSVREKAIEELREALLSIENISVANHPKSITLFDKEELETSLQESIDAIISLTYFVAIICTEYEISWCDMWTQQYEKLKAKGFVKG